jgi:hypothetical protein
LQCVPLARKGLFDKALYSVGCEKIPRLHAVNLHFFRQGVHFVTFLYILI